MDTAVAPQALQARNTAQMKSLPQEVVDMICDHIMENEDRWRSSILRNQASGERTNVKHARFINRNFNLGAARVLFRYIFANIRLTSYNNMITIANSPFAGFVRGLNWKSSTDRYEVEPRLVRVDEAATQVLKIMSRFENLNELSLDFSDQWGAASKFIKSWIPYLHEAADKHKLNRLSLSGYRFIRELGSKLLEVESSQPEQDLQIRKSLAGIKTLDVIWDEASHSGHYGDLNPLAPYMAGVTTLHIHGLCEPSNPHTEVLFPHMRGLEALSLTRSNLTVSSMIHFIHSSKDTLRTIKLSDCRSTSGGWARLLKYVRTECLNVVELCFIRTDAWREPRPIKVWYTLSGSILGNQTLSRAEVRELIALAEQIDKNREAAMLEPEYHPLMTEREYAEYRLSVELSKAGIS